MYQNSNNPKRKVRTKRVSISLPDELVERIDQAAKQSFQSRSAYIRSAVFTKLRYEGEPEIPNTISDQDFERAKAARALKSINKMLHETE